MTDTVYLTPEGELEVWSREFVSLTGAPAIKTWIINYSSRGIFHGVFFSKRGPKSYGRIMLGPLATASDHAEMLTDLCRAITKRPLKNKRDKKK